MLLINKDKYFEKNTGDFILLIRNFRNEQPLRVMFDMHKIRYVLMRFVGYVLLMRFVGYVLLMRFVGNVLLMRFVGYVLLMRSVGYVLLIRSVGYLLMQSVRSLLSMRSVIYVPLYANS